MRSPCLYFNVNDLPMCNKMFLEKLSEEGAAQSASEVCIFLLLALFIRFLHSFKRRAGDWAQELKLDPGTRPSYSVVNTCL